MELRKAPETVRWDSFSCFKSSHLLLYKDTCMYVGVQSDQISCNLATK